MEVLNFIISCHNFELKVSLLIISNQVQIVLISFYILYWNTFLDSTPQHFTLSLLYFEIINTGLYTPDTVF